MFEREKLIKVENKISSMSEEARRKPVRLPGTHSPTCTMKMACKKHTLINVNNVKLFINYN